MKTRDALSHLHKYAAVIDQFHPYLHFANLPLCLLEWCVIQFLALEIES